MDVVSHSQKGWQEGRTNWLIMFQEARHRMGGTLGGPQWPAPELIVHVLMINWINKEVLPSDY